MSKVLNIGQDFVDSLLGAGGDLVHKSVDISKKPVVGARDALGLKPYKPPKVTPPKPMPIADDKAVLEARKRSIAAQVARSGRASTILTSEKETLG